MIQNYEILDKVVYRSHLMGFDPFPDNKKIEDLIDNELFLEVIYTNSPSLYDRIINFRKKNIIENQEKKQIYSAIRTYYKRMAFRSTPFGLVSGVGVSNFGNKTVFNFKENKFYKRKTVLDHSLSVAIVSKVLVKYPKIIFELKWKLNETIFSTSQGYNYIKATDNDEIRNYSSFNISKNEYINTLIKICKGKFLHFSDIQDKFLKIYSEFKPFEFEEFFEILYKENIFLSELSSSVTGFDLIHVLSGVLKKNVEYNREFTALRKIIKKINKLDTSFTNEINDYREIIQLIHYTFELEYNENKTFNIVFTKSDGETILNNSIRRDVRKLAEVLYRITNFNEGTPRLTDFYKEFIKRYGESEISLLQALDSNIGIRYGTSGKNHSLLKNNIKGLQSDSKFYIGKNESYFNNLMILALLNGKDEIQLTEEHINKLSNNRKEKFLPPSFSLMLQDIGNFENKQFLLKMMGSGSAINFLGRFANSNNEILKLCNEINRREEEILDEKTIQAEIVHIAQDRVANVIKHPSFRSYEIPCMTLTGKDVETILLEDLYLKSTDGRKVQLYSKKLNKIVRPVKSNMHNAETFGLPLYQFLCDFQNANYLSNTSFYWGNMWIEYSYTPRVTYKNIILVPRTWHLQKESLGDLNIGIGIIDKICTELKIPEKILLSDGDNILPIDLCNKFDKELLIKYIKKKKIVRIQEYCFGKNFIAKSYNGESYSNEYVFSFVQKSKIKRILSPTPLQNENILKECRDFLPLNEWCYLKLYCERPFMNKLLSNLIRSFICDNNESIKEWFFIRYYDSDHHLRFRFKSDDKKLIELLNDFLQRIKPLTTTKEIWKVSIESYQRELNRYGQDLIKNTERIFTIDSNKILSYLSKELNWINEGVDLLLFSASFINTILEVFDFNVEQKEQFMKQLKYIFQKEIAVNSTERQKYYRKIESKRIKEFILSDHPIKYYYKKELKEVYKKIKSENDKIDFKNYLSSIIHMHINRLFDQDQRMCEALIYDYMQNAYLSIFRQNTGNENLC